MSTAKRKQPPNNEQSSRKRQRVKMHDARVIATQTTGKAFGNGEIDVDKFVKAREFEINALEDAIRRSKKGLSSRAFQDVPRELRRRTASHNVKRVPKRLRRRAAKEMADDNTPTVSSRTRKPTSRMRLRLDTAMRLRKLRTKHRKKKESAEKGTDGVALPRSGLKETTKTPKVPKVKKNKLQNPPMPKAKFRKRQRYKAWLPTHLFHAKRAHMTPPKEPLWRMAIPLSPTAKSYRPTHRASSLRGAIAWDMSYMSTIGLDGPLKSLQNLLEALGVDSGSRSSSQDRQTKRWLAGTRIWEGWLYERDSSPPEAIAPVTIIWCVKEQPSPQNLSKSAHKRIEHDYRKIFIRVHPSAFRQLWDEVLKLSKIQKPVVTVEDLRFEIGSIEVKGPSATELLVGTLWPVADSEAEDKPAAVWPRLASVPNISSLPADVMMAFDVSDPRLHHPPKAVQISSEPEAHQQLLNTLATWPIDQTQSISGLFDYSKRHTASRSLPSQKAINRRRTLAGPGEYPAPSDKDPKIPVLLFASRTYTQNQASWTVMMPWKCILPVWYSLMYCPLSIGGTARFGGLEQRRQIAFESQTPWFPADFPGTKAGKEWELRERAKRKAEWESKPKAKRVEWDTLNLSKDKTGEIGLGWACDWLYLLNNALGSSSAQMKGHHISKSVATAALSDGTVAPELLDHGLVAVRMTLCSRGVPTTCARIYQLPTDDKELRKTWIDLLPEHRKGLPQKSVTRKVPQDAPDHIRRKLLAAALLDGPTDRGANAGNHVKIPTEQNLIGFVTTGNFNLGEGRATAIGCIALQRVLDQSVQALRRYRHICIIRETGTTIGRLARWELA